MPPLHLVIVILQRGTIIPCGLAGIVAVPPIAPCIMVPMPMPVIPSRHPHAGPFHHH